MKVSYFTDPRIQAALSDPAFNIPLAIHVEHQSLSWLDGGPVHHGRLCAEILGGPLLDSGKDWVAGLFDQGFYDWQSFLQAAHPATRLMTISTSYACVPKQDFATVAEVAPLILKAVGNEGADWRRRRKNDSLSALHFQPGFMRIGEAKTEGELHPHSQASGPAFVCSHPFHQSQDYGFIFHPTQQEIDAFQDHARQNGYASDPMPAAWSGGKIKHGKTGTSFSTPHAGAMIMHHSAGMTGLTSYDILPAVLLAAQDRPPRAGGRNRRGLIFDSSRTGFGYLEDAPLSQRLRQIWRLTQECGGNSMPLRSSASGDAVVETPGDGGPVVNVAVLLDFRTDRQDKRAENDVPLYIQLKSPAGTKICLPLLIERTPGSRYEGHIRAGFQTVAFLGEDITHGQWEIACPFRLFGKYRINQAEIVAHSLPQGSPAAIMLDQYRRYPYPVCEPGNRRQTLMQSHIR